MAKHWHQKQLSIFSTLMHRWNVEKLNKKYFYVSLSYTNIIFIEYCIKMFSTICVFKIFADNSPINPINVKHKRERAIQLLLRRVEKACHIFIIMSFFHFFIKASETDVFSCLKVTFGRFSWIFLINEKISKQFFQILCGLRFKNLRKIFFWNIEDVF